VTRGRADARSQKSEVRNQNGNFGSSGAAVHIKKARNEARILLKINDRAVSTSARPFLMDSSGTRRKSKASPTLPELK
jgi:hypothetical protein